MKALASLLLLFISAYANSATTYLWCPDNRLTVPDNVPYNPYKVSNNNNYGLALDTFRMKAGVRVGSRKRKSEYTSTNQTIVEHTDNGWDLYVIKHDERNSYVRLERSTLILFSYDEWFTREEYKQYQCNIVSREELDRRFSELDKKIEEERRERDKQRAEEKAKMKSKRKI